LQEVLKAAPASIDGVLNDYEVPRIDTVEQESSHTAIAPKNL
jgi:hypothetical protein